MDAFGSAIAAVVRSSVAPTIIAWADRTAKAAFCGIVAAFLVTGSLGCALAALWIWELPRLGPAGAPLVVAGALLVGSLVALGLMRHTLRPRRRPLNAGASADLSLADALRLFKDNKSTVLMAAVIAGLMAGRNEK